jgi:periplasmic divalent cation tolerance protein
VGRRDDPAPAPAPIPRTPASCILVTTVTPTRGDADRLALSAVEQRLAACAQISGPIASHYRWQGTLECSAEWRVEFKTTSGRYPALEALVRSLHAYQVPEIIAIPIAGGSAEYLAWVDDEVTKGR